MMTMAICSTRPWGGGGLPITYTHTHTYPNSGSAAKGRQRHLFQSSTGEREQHMCAGEGEESREGSRQRKQRAEKCGFYLTAFVVLPHHARGLFACV